jgi:hypothetical protein
MIRQRVLAWPAILALVVAVQLASLSIRLPASLAETLAQAAPTAAAGQPIDLPVVALYCAAAPAAEALTTFLASGTAPTGCAPAVGARIAVTENGSPLAGSPFTTDTSGTLGVRVGSGSAVTLQEDPKSLPSGYEPLTQEANGVPYANPVQLDSAVAGTAALFVNVPSSVVATLAQGTPTAVACQQTNRVGDVTPTLQSAAQAATASLTSASASPGGGTMINGANGTLYTSGGNSGLAAPVSHGDLAVANRSDGIGDGEWVLPPDRNRTDNWLGRRDRYSTGNLAIVSNPVVIGNGLWTWGGPSRAGNGFWLNRLAVGNLTVAGSSTGNLAIVSNPVVIGNGLWTWGGPSRAGNGFWLNRLAVGNLTVAGSSTGNLAIVSNPVVIGNGLWTWGGPSRAGNWLEPAGGTHADGTDVELLTINGGPAVELPLSTLEQPSNNEQPTHTTDGTLSDTPTTDSIQLPSDDAVAPPSDAVAPPVDSAAPPADSMALSSDSSVQPSSDNAVQQSPSDPAVAPPSDAAVESPPSDASVEPPPDAVQPPSDNFVAPPSDNSVQPPADFVAPPSDTVAPPADSAALPADSVAPPADSVAPPDTAVAPPSDNFVQTPPNDGAQTPPSDTVIAPPSDAVVQSLPDNSAALPSENSAAPNPVNVMPEPVNVGAGNGDFGNIGQNPIDVSSGNGVVGVDPGNSAPVPVNVGSSFAPGNAMPNPVNDAPNPINVAPGNGDFGNGGLGNSSPDPINAGPGNGDSGNGAPDLGIGQSDQGPGGG